MTDFASLQLSIDSRQVKEGVGELDKLTAAGARAETATGSLAKSQAVLKAELYAGSITREQYLKQLYGAEQATKMLGSATVKTGGQIRTASQQAADYAANTQRMANNAGLGGRNINRLGSEVATLTGQLAAGNIGAQGLATSLGRVAIAAAAAASAVAATVGVIAGLAGLAALGVKQSAASDAEMKKFAATLGLTAKEMKRLEDVTVTWGDVGTATFEVLAEAAGTSASEIKAWMGDAFETIGEFGKFSIGVIVAAFVAGGKFIANVFMQLPNIVSEAAVGAANFAIAAFEKMINTAAVGLNALIVGVNFALGKDIPTVAGVTFDRMKNTAAGTGAAIAKGLKDDFFGTFDAVQGGFDKISQRATDISARRIAGQARDIIGDRTPNKGKSDKGDADKKKALTEQEKAYIAAMKAAKAYFGALEEETAKIGKSAIEIKRMDVATAAAAAQKAALIAPTKEGTLALLDQATAITKAGAAWEAATKKQDIAEFIKNVIEPLEFETSLLGKNASEQAMLRAEREATAAGIDRGTEAWTRYLVAVDAAGASERAIAESQALLDNLNLIADQASVAGQAMADAFGGVGSVIGDLIANMADFSAEKQALDLEVLKGTKTQMQADKQLATLEMKNAAQAISGVKSLFKEKSTAFKVMSAIEKAYAAFQLATSIASIIQGKVETANAVADSATQTAANTTAGASKIFKQLGAWAFPVVGAMIALLALLGAKGGGGGGSGPSMPTAEDIQSGAGTGSILGDSKAKSESIARSLEIVASNTNRDLEYSNAMLKALRSIDFSIAKLAGTIAKQIQVSGSLFDTSKLNLGTSGSGGFLGIGAKSTTKTLWDLGLNLQSSSVADIIANGIAGSTYQTVQKVKKKSGFLGIGGGTKTSYKTSSGALDPEIASAIQDVVTSLRDGLLAAADVIGLAGADAILASFNVSLGKISFKDMTGEQIEDQLNAIFSKVGDDMAGAIYPALQGMQKIGEGLFETFIRVAREYEVVDMALKSIGKTFGMVGINSVAARDSLVQLFGGLEEFVEATDFFRDQFLSEAEQIAPIAASVTAELARLGMTGLTTRDQFKQAVLGLDLTTTAGREMYASLLAVAPAFDKTLDYFERLNKTATDALSSTVDQFTKFAESLRKYRDTLFAADGAQGASTAILRARFAATATLAAGGDATALGGLESAGKAFLDSARNSASSRIEYLRDVAMVAQGVDKGIFAAEATADYAQLQLDALKNATSILQQISENTAISAAAVPVTAGGVQSLPSNETADPVLLQQNATIIQQNAEIIDLMRRQERIFSRWDGDGIPEERVV